MDALTLRQRMTAANIANIDTAGFQKLEVRFEDELRRAQANGGIKAMSRVTASIVQSAQPMEIENEMLEMADTQIRVQMVTRSLRHHFDMLRIGITGNNR